MQGVEVVAIAGAISMGMLSALYFVVWRALRPAWAAYYALAFLLIMLTFAFDSKIQPHGDHPNLISTTLSFVSGWLMVLGMNDFAALPWRIARSMSWLAGTASVVTISLAALQAIPRVVAFVMVCAFSLLLALQAIMAIRTEPGSGWGLVLLAMMLYPFTLLAAVFNLIPLPMLRYASAVPITMTGLTILTMGLLRAQRRSDRAERELRFLNESLERRVDQRTVELQEVVDRLDRVNVELTAVNASRTRLLAAACHDLRQPTHALGLLAELAAERIPPQAREPIEGIRRCSAALSDMLDMLLDMTQLESDRYRPVFSTFRLDELFQELQLQFAPVAETKALSFHVDHDNVQVSSDRHLLRRMLMNLVSNAIKYTDSGSVHVKVQRHAGEVVITVEDTGPGIPADQRELVFADYVRLNGLEQSEGLGIGLSIVKRAAALLNHRLELESQVGQGTAIHLTVPLSAVPLKLAEPSLFVEGRGRLIGVLENDENILAATVQLLTSHRFVVAPGRDLEELERALADQGRPAPDLLISDLHLGSGLDGLRLIESLRNAAAWHETAYILVTGDLDVGIAVKASAMNVALAYKPIQPRRLLSLVDQILGSRQRAGLSAGHAAR